MKKRFAILAILTLPIFAACDDNDDNSGNAQSETAITTVDDEGHTSAGSETPPQSSASITEQPSTLPHAEGDPCAEYSSFQNTECDLVGWADLNDDGLAEPIGIATTGAPALRVTSVVDGDTASYSPEATNSANLPPLGPDVGNMDNRRHSAFVGAFEMTGEGPPEIVLWVDKGGTIDTFHVLSFSDGEFEPLDMPNPGLHGGGAHWASSVLTDLPSYRCTDSADSPLEVVAESEQGPQAKQVKYDPDARRYEMSDADMENIEVKRGRPTVGLDCDDVAEHEPAPAVPTNGPGLRCPMGRDEPVPQSDDLGELLEAEVSKGDLDCDEIESMWEEYENTPKSQREHGKSLIVDFGDHTCSTGSVMSAPGQEPIGGCTSLDDEWKFMIGSR